MTRATRSAEYTGERDQILHLSFELGNNDWKLGFTTDHGAKPRLRTMPARDLGRLEREIEEAKRGFGLAATARVRSCYEAGRDGFWLHRYLVSRDIDNGVVDSSSLEVNRRMRRAQSDSLGARKLLTMLVRYHAGERKVWSVVRVPTVEEEDRRQLHRELRTLKKERTRTTNRVKGLLANQGIRLEKSDDLRQRLEESHRVGSVREQVLQRFALKDGGRGPSYEFADALYGLLYSIDSRDGEERKWYG